MKNFFVSCFLVLSGGIAQWCAGQPLGWWPLSFFGLAALWIVTVRGSAKSGAWWALVWATTYFLLLFDWAASAAHTVLAQIALSLLEALFIVVVGILWNGCARVLRWGAAPCAAFIWVAIEYLRSTWPLGGMPWGSVGYTVVDSPLANLAPYGSVALVSFVTVAISVSFGQALISRRGLTIIATGMLSIIAIGACIFIPIGAPPVGTLDAAIVQGSVPDPPGEDRALQVTRNHVAAALKIVSTKHDLVLLPESTSDLDFRRDPDAGAIISQLTQATSAPILLGSQSFSGNTRLNEYVSLDRGEVVHSYAKQHPVPFGEYIPYRDVLRKVTTAVDQVAVDMVPGHAQALINVHLHQRTIPIATPICFEIADTGVVAQAIRSGAQLIVAPTNNATFQGTGEPLQQFAIAKFRAIEFGRAVVQVATSGISGVIDARGNTVYRVVDNIPDARVVRLTLSAQKTFAATTEEQRVVLLGVLGSISGIVAVGGLLRKRKERV
ncbi:apolipoprotein N-acyltransferase [Arcanobacterium canis]